ncbi:hypothetical protein CgunFtcFv8_004498 [Champsocephalus gunnari]|uniref:Uncharacterized protein n=1 Tax=Champsocephalus gunnari TaxID=52237 RepID=A0AAN8HXL1_CHAGU|nr:hypothetical protein CgunFtcFv8_004498 [Champsocephalus gunnari]
MATKARFVMLWESMSLPARAKESPSAPGEQMPSVQWCVHLTAITPCVPRAALPPVPVILPHHLPQGLFRGLRV